MSRTEPDEAVSRTLRPISFGKIHSDHTSLEPQTNHRTIVLKQTPTLVNVMEGSHTNNCIAHPYYNCH